MKTITRDELKQKIENNQNIELLETDRFYC